MPAFIESPERNFGSSILQRPNSLFVQGEEVYVTDGNQNLCVQVFDRLGQPLRTIGAGQFMGPQGPGGVAVLGEEVYVTDLDGNEIQVCHRNGTLLRNWGGEFNTPGRIAVSCDEVYVTDSGNNRVQVFERHSGTFLRPFGSALSGGSGIGELNQPNGAFVHGHEVYVTEAVNRRLQVFARGAGRI